MGRTARLDISGYWYHVIARGQRKDDIFLSNRDYSTYLRFLGDILTKHNIPLCAYCLMPNHIHLLMYRQEVSLGDIFRRLHTHYAKYFNEVHQTVGHVFQNRFKSLIVLNERYLLTLLRYIHHNPVKKKLVKDSRDYPWSSENLYLGNKCIFSNHLVRAPGLSGTNGIRIYQELRQSVAPNYSDLPIDGQMIGTKEEQEKLERRHKKKTPPAGERRKQQSLQSRFQELTANTDISPELLVSKSQKHIISAARKALMAQLYREGYSPSSIAKLFNRTAATVIHAADSIGYVKSTP